MSLLLLYGGGTPAPTPVFTNTNTPNLTDFLTFLATSVQIPTSALPANSPWPSYAFNQALDLVYYPAGFMAPGILYCLAVYNCATHLLFMMTPDVAGQSYFANARGNSSSATPPGLGLNTASTGLVVSASDNGTSSTLTAPMWASGMTISALGFFRTPWGRDYLAWQQSWGPTIVGLS